MTDPTAPPAPAARAQESMHTYGHYCDGCRTAMWCDKVGRCLAESNPADPILPMEAELASLRTRLADAEARRYEWNTFWFTPAELVQLLGTHFARAEAAESKLAAAEQARDTLRANARERLAALAHEQWLGWMRHLFSKCRWERVMLVVPVEWEARWKRQMETPYAQLTESERDSDRAEADRVLAVLAALPAGDAPGTQGEGS